MRFSSTLLALALLGASAASRADAPAYHVGILGGCPIGFCTGEGFNLRRDYGFHYIPDHENGVDWSAVEYADGSSAGMTLPGGRFSHINVISDRGDALGFSLDADANGLDVALIDRQLIALDANGQPVAGAGDINNRQQIAGTVRLPDGTLHAAIIQAGIGYQDLGTLGGTNSYAGQINDQGDVVGNSQLPNGDTHSFLYHDGRMTDLNSLPGFLGVETDINNDGLLSGSYRDGRAHAFLYRGGIRIDIADPGDESSIAGLNNRGEAIGFVNGRPFVWHDGQRFDLLSLVLDPLPVDFGYFMGLNDNGEIAFDGCSTQRQVCAFVVLMPVPEPGRGAQLAFGLPLLLAWQLRRRRRAG